MILDISNNQRASALFLSYVHSNYPRLLKKSIQDIQAISYEWYDTQFGKILLGSADDCICFAHFTIDTNPVLIPLKLKNKNLILNHKSEPSHQHFLNFIQEKNNSNQEINILLIGSDFQIKVWESLLKIPFGKTSTYKNIAIEINQPNASRAVGTAIGQNNIAMLIPCHRVIQTSGGLGGYMWGIERKKEILQWENS